MYFMKLVDSSRFCLFYMWFQAQKWYPWRSFLAIHGLHPFIIWDVSQIEHYMQVCNFANAFCFLVFICFISIKIMQSFFFFFLALPL